MVTTDWPGDTYPDSAPLVILHPLFTAQHALLPRIEHRAQGSAQLVALEAEPGSLAALCHALKVALHAVNGQDAGLPAELEGRSPEVLADLALDDLKPIRPYTLFIDTFEALPSDESAAWLIGLLKGLPPDCQIVLGGHRMSHALLDAVEIRAQGRLFPVNNLYMLPDYLHDPSPSTRVDVRAHGQGRVYINGVEVTAWDGLLPKALFFFLVDRGMATRDTIFSMFWPSLAKREATNVFHVTKRKVSELLGFDLTVYQSGFYRVAPEVDLHYDTAEFLNMVQRSELADEDEALIHLFGAVRLYRGVYLSSVDMPWVHARREGLQATYGDALLALARLLDKRQQPVEALRFFTRATAFQPVREDTARELMTFCAQHALTEQAARVFARLQTNLAAVDRVPSAATLALAQRLFG